MARRRLTVQQAAEELSLTVDAIRQRVRRESLESEKVDGRVYVWLVDDEYADKSKSSAEGSELFEVLREEVLDLRGRLDREQEANRENRRIIAALTERIPEIEAPSSSPEQPDATESADEGPGRGRTPQDVQTGSQRRSWWRRVFGG